MPNSKVVKYSWEVTPSHKPKQLGKLVTNTERVLFYAVIWNFGMNCPTIWIKTGTASRTIQSITNGLVWQQKGPCKTTCRKVSYKHNQGKVNFE